METLANQLPPDAVHFSSKLAKIETSADGETILELVDGSRIQAKVGYISLVCFQVNIKLNESVIHVQSFCRLLLAVMGLVLG